MKIKLTVIPVFAFIFLYVNAFGQSTSERLDGEITLRNGEAKEVEIFNSSPTVLCEYVFTYEGTKKKYAPKDLLSFEFGEDGEKVRYKSLEIEGKQYFLRQYNNYSLYVLKKKKSKTRYFIISKNDGANVITEVKNGQTLKYFADKNDVTIDPYKKLNINYLNKTISNFNGMENMETYKLGSDNLIGVGYLPGTLDDVFEINYTSKGIFDYKFLEWQTKFQLGVGERNNIYSMVTGLNFKFHRGIFQPYFYLGVGAFYTTATNVKRKVLPIIFPIPGCDIRLNKNNYLKIESYYFIPSIGYMRRL